MLELFFTTEPQPFPSRDKQLAMQAILVEKFFANINKEFLEEQMGPAKTFHDVCSWDYPLRSTNSRLRDPIFHIECHSEIIRTVFIHDVQPGNFQIPFAPNSIRFFRIASAQQRFVMCTRLLPLRARYIYLTMNEITGTVDCQHFPPKLETFDAAGNHISGLTLLADLPASLRYLRLSTNWIQQDVLYYGDLPKGLELVELGNAEIRRIQRVSKEVDRRIVFYGKDGFILDQATD